MSRRKRRSARFAYEGVRAHYRCCDVTDEGQLRRVVQDVARYVRSDHRGNPWRWFEYVRKRSNDL